jgi:hypothetical protein
LIISMDDGEKQSLEQIRALVEASEEVRFHSQDRGELYEWVDRTLRQQDYGRLKRSGKGLVRRYIAKMTGLSRSQAARLIRCYQGGGAVNGPGMSFTTRSANGWRVCRWRSYTGCERAGRTATAAWPINQRDPRRWRSENGANPIRKGDQDICAWTLFIKGIWTE